MNGKKERKLKSFSFKMDNVAPYENEHIAGVLERVMDVPLSRAQTKLAEYIEYHRDKSLFSPAEIIHYKLDIKPDTRDGRLVCELPDKKLIGILKGIAEIKPAAESHAYSSLKSIAEMHPDLGPSIENFKVTK